MRRKIFTFPASHRFGLLEGEKEWHLVGAEFCSIIRKVSLLRRPGKYRVQISRCIYSPATAEIVEVRRSHADGFS